MVILLILFIRINSSADEIHLDDGKVLKGKILRMDQDNVEYIPEGDKSFILVPRSSVKRVFYTKDFPDDKSAKLKNSQTKGIAYPRSKSSACLSSCLVPFWSDSWNYGYTNAGLFFSLSKLLAFTAIFYSLNKFSENIMSDEGLAWRDNSIVSAIAYLILVIVDINYSFDQVKEKNIERPMHGLLTPRAGSKIYILLSSRNEFFGAKEREKNFQGINISLGYRL
jgi:hypothetical protein